MWRKKLIQKESGTTQHHYGAAAKAIEAERARKSAEDAMRTRIAAEAAVKALAEDTAVSSATAIAHAAADAAARAAEVRHTAEFALALSDPEHETEKVEKLYQRLVEARTETGEKAGVPSLKDFERFVRQKTKDLKEKGGREIEYTVSIEGGHVKLKARVSS
jgi:transcriptional regulator of acetoin/glycerol metabolism